MKLGEMTGRRVIYTDETKIDKSNIAKVLQDAYMKHLANSAECEKLLNIEAGIQPLPQKKLTRTDIDARVIDNVANEITEFKCAFVWSNAVTLVQRGETDTGSDNKQENEGISLLNEMYAAEFNGRKQQDIHSLTLIRIGERAGRTSPTMYLTHGSRFLSALADLDTV